MGRKKYPVACKTKNTVMQAAKARATGGCVKADEDKAPHKAKEIGAMPGAGPMKRGDRMTRTTSSKTMDGMPIMSSASGKKK